MESKNTCDNLTTNVKMLLTVNEAAEALNLCTKNVYRLANTDSFPCFRLGKKVLIPVDALERWIEEQTQAAKSC